MRAIVLVVSVLVSLALAGCVSSETPDNSDSAHSIPASSEYRAQRAKAFAAWQKGIREGTIEGDQIWDCPLCPIMRARRPLSIWAGSTDSDPDWQSNEPPLTSVKIERPYAVAIHEVTRGEFGAFVTATNRNMTGGCNTDRMDPEAGFLNPGFEQTDNHPAVCVSWDDANDYVAWLNSRTTGGYRLPTEAEWQGSGFGGGYPRYLWGEQPEPACFYANILDVTGASNYPAAAVDCNDEVAYTAPVGRYLPGAMRQYDVIGNAAEWTATCFSTRASGSGCSSAIVKGGSWKSPRVELRRAARRALPADFRDNSLGFRVTKTMPDPDLRLKHAADYLARGRRKLGQLEFDSARVDLERAADMDPRNSHAVSARGWARLRTEKVAKARKDFSAALELDEANAEAMAGMGMCALLDGNPRETVRQLDKVLGLAPNYVMAKALRASAHQLAGNLDQALADSADVLRVAPTDVEQLQLRVHLRGQRFEWPEAVMEVRRMTRALPTLSISQRFAASVYSALMLDEQAMAAATLALSDFRTGENYLLRAHVRPWADVEGRREDIAAALEIEPGSIPALIALGQLEARVGQHDAASRAFTAVIERGTAGHRVDALIWRGIELQKLGDLAGATRDFSAALGPRPGASVLNDLCWYLMEASLALDRAMTYCDQSLRLRPGKAETMDSKATLMLRLGKWSDAIRLYDEALALQPDLANSLYGRGIAKQSRCRCRDGSADLEKASQFMPAIRRNFERIGFVAPYPPAMPDFG
jgi:sulfatase modifying factor 1